MSFGTNLIWATTVHNRRQYERWQIRSKAKTWFVLKCYLAWSAVFAVWGGAVSYWNPPGNRAAQSTLTLEHIVLSGTIGLCCFGPLALIGCLVLLSSGLARFESARASLIHQRRVCKACDVASFYEGDQINLEEAKGHTAADLIPHMNVIKEDGNVSVLCDKCLSAVNAMASDQ